VKKCSVDGCENPIFGGGFCKYHGFKRYMRGGDLYKPKPRKASKIPKESKKRKQDNKRYLERLKDRWQESVDNKTNFCFFCGEFMDARQDCHHLRDRGVTILEEELWVWAHRVCHSKYHSYTIHQLKQESWFLDFLRRVELKDYSTYCKIQRMIDKSNEELF